MSERFEFKVGHTDYIAGLYGDGGDILLIEPRACDANVPQALFKAMLARIAELEAAKPAPCDESHGDCAICGKPIWAAVWHSIHRECKPAPWTPPDEAAFEAECLAAVKQAYGGTWIAKDIDPNGKQFAQIMCAPRESEIARLTAEVNNLSSHVDACKDEAVSYDERRKKAESALAAANDERDKREQILRENHSRNFSEIVGKCDELREKLAAANAEIDRLKFRVGIAEAGMSAGHTIDEVRAAFVAGCQYGYKTKTIDWGKDYFTKEATRRYPQPFTSTPLPKCPTCCDSRMILTSAGQKPCPACSTPQPVDADAHPEDICERCGRDNITWFAPNDVWNKTLRHDDGSDIYSILCPVCFVKLAETAGFNTDAWLVAPEFHHSITPFLARPTHTPTSAELIAKWNEVAKKHGPQALLDNPPRDQYDNSALEIMRGVLELGAQPMRVTEARLEKLAIQYEFVFGIHGTPLIMRPERIKALRAVLAELGIEVEGGVS